MRPVLLLLALAACGKESRPPSETLTLTPKAPAVGLVISEDSSQRSAMTLTRDAEKSLLREDEHEVSRAEVLEVADGAITKVRIRYEVKQITRTVDDQRTVEASPLEGHTYVVWLDGGEIKAAREDGEPIGDAEAAALAEDHGDLGRVPPIVRALADRTWTRGEAVDLGDEGTFTWIGENVFSTTKTFVKDDDRGHIVTRMTGQLQIDRDELRPTSVTTTGTSSGDLRGPMAGTTLDGTTEAHASYRYQ